MTEPTPPPERPLPDDARARIRADLLGHARDHRSTAPRWVVPAGAAAAVALVAGLSYWAISPGGHDPAGGPAGGGGGASFAPTTERPSSVPSVDPSVPPGTEPSNAPGTESSVPASAPPESFQVGTGSCKTELENVLKGADKAFVFPPWNDAGTSAIYVKGEKFSLCDSREGTTTVTHPLPLVPSDDVTTYRVLSIFPPTSDGYQTIRVAGGRVPAGVLAFDVSYTFPDGHTQQAITSTDDQGRTWWLMVYRYDEGGGNETQKPPIEVTVSYSGVQEHYTLEWGVDTCAQANHGC